MRKKRSGRLLARGLVVGFALGMVALSSATGTAVGAGAGQGASQGAGLGVSSGPVVVVGSEAAQKAVMGQNNEGTNGVEAASPLAVVPTTVVSISVQKGDLGEVVRGIAKSAGLQVYGADSLQGQVTVEEGAIDPLVLLERLSREKHFSFHQEGQILWVDGEGAENVKGRVAYVIKPKFLRIDRLAQAFTGIVHKEAIQVLPEENAMVIYATPLQRQALAKVQEAVDKKPLQVHLQVQVLAREKGKVADRGITWNFGHVNEGASKGKEGGSKEGGSNLRIGHLQGRSFYLPIDANVSLQDSSLMSTVVAQPSIQTVSGREASILIGDRVPVIIESVKNGVTSQSVSYQDTGIQLKYTPYVTESGMIDADVSAEVSSPALVPEMKAYRITTREAHTRVRLKSGETMVIGGLLDSRGDTHNQRVPFLSDIPVLGALFKHARKAKQSVELYILLTATVVKDEPEHFEKGIGELQKEGTVGQLVL